ncbi:hypothetical protein R1sor_019042 [Riccia sorocarpa]|uniref:Uncharacterized protein n=1 Tax=Riccia sorocarpa TaxID=122646 RepID=A0ABD3IF08_9MARC
MHIEANVTKSLIKRIFGKKDGKPARRAYEEFGVHPEAWIQVSDRGIESLPPTPWILTTEERKICRQHISEIRLPTSFGSCLRKAFEKDGAKWPATLKSHDYHILLQYVLPIVLQGLGSQDLRDAIYDLSALMRWVCSKTVRTTDIDEKGLFAITTLSQLVGPRPTIVHDEIGLMRVNTTSTLPFTRITDEPYIYPSLVEQCFYVECSDDPDWSVVIQYIPRERHIVQDRPSLTIVVDLDPIEDVPDE